MNQTEDRFAEGRHLNEEGVALYVDALKLERTSGLPENILRHVEKCRRCKVEIAGLYTLLQDQDYSRLGPHPYFDRGVEGHHEARSPIYRIAAGFAIVLLLGAAICLLSYLKGTREPPGSPAVQTRAVGVDTGVVKRVPDRPSGAERQLPKAEDLASRFTESPELEDLMRSEVRSAGVEIISPSIGQTVQGEVHFQWDSTSRPPFTLVILSNRGAVRKEVTLAGPRYTLKERLEDGLYYWKLIADGELLCVGKFLIKSQRGHA
jgi:hypothetical protein